MSGVAWRLPQATNYEERARVPMTTTPAHPIRPATGPGRPRGRARHAVRLRKAERPHAGAGHGFAKASYVASAGARCDQCCVTKENGCSSTAECSLRKSELSTRDRGVR